MLSSLGIEHRVVVIEDHRSNVRIELFIRSVRKGIQKTKEWN